MLCYLLEGLMTEENVPEGSSKDVYELYFVWACVWAFGGALFQDQLCDHRVEFTKWWSAEFKQIKFPSQVKFLIKSTAPPKHIYLRVLFLTTTLTLNKINSVTGPKWLLKTNSTLILKFLFKPQWFQLPKRLVSDFGWICLWKEDDLLCLSVMLVLVKLYSFNLRPVFKYFSKLLYT